MAKKDDNFIMLPTVDVCFKGLMYNPKVRKGFIAALLKADPASVRETILLPTALRQEYPDEKLGILDVRTMMEDGAQINMEMQAYPFGEWDARALFYLSKMYAEQIGRGDPYTKLKKCIHVSILGTCGRMTRSSAGCVSWQGRAGRSWRIWQVQANILRRPTGSWRG